MLLNNYYTSAYVSKVCFWLVVSMVSILLLEYLWKTCRTWTDFSVDVKGCENFVKCKNVKKNNNNEFFSSAYSVEVIECGE